MRLSGVFGPPEEWPDQDLVAWSSEFDVPLTLDAYAAGVFPMPVPESALPESAMGWWSPVRRGVLPLSGLRVSRSLRKSARRYRVSVDAAFGEVLARCGDSRRPDGWIDDDIVAVYSHLHELGYAHSVEVWTPSGQLVGGLYGVSLRGLFAGESMFHDPQHGRDASKVALLHLVRLLDDGDPRRVLDVQWVTPHLASLGAVEVGRAAYLQMLSIALDAPTLDWARAREPQDGIGSVPRPHEPGSPPPLPR